MCSFRKGWLLFAMVVLVAAGLSVLSSPLSTAQERKAPASQPRLVAKAVERAKGRSASGEKEEESERAEAKPSEKEDEKSEQAAGGTEKDEGESAEKDEQGEEGEKGAESAEAKEQPVELSSLPQNVRAALEKQAGKAKIDKVVHENEDGHDLFEASWKSGENIQEATVTKDGVVVQLEELIESDEAPKAVRQAAEQHFKGAKNIKFERRMVVIYEAIGNVGDRTEEVLFSPFGSSVVIEESEK